MLLFYVIKYNISIEKNVNVLQKKSQLEKCVKRSTVMSERNSEVKENE